MPLKRSPGEGGHQRAQDLSRGQPEARAAGQRAARRADGACRRSRKSNACDWIEMPMASSVLQLLSKVGSKW